MKTIDAHGHYGPYFKKGIPALTEQFLGGDADTVVARADLAGIQCTVVSPLSALLPRGQADAVAGNREAARTTPLHPRLRQYVVVNPRQPETYDQATEMLKEPWCVGIKIHPEEHLYPIARYGDELFSFFSECQVPVLTHSGCPNSLPADFLPFIEKYPRVQLILAHIGHGGGDGNRPDLQIEVLEQTVGASVYADTSSAQSMLSGLIEWAVDRVGSDRILFGTDTPLYHPGAQLGRIIASSLSMADKQKILYENAKSLFRLQEPLP